MQTLIIFIKTRLPILQVNSQVEPSVVFKMKTEVLAGLSVLLLFSASFCGAVEDPFGFSSTTSDHNLPRFRLRGGPSPGVGFLQSDIKDSSWKTLCVKENFGIDEANVLCRENGYGEALHVGKGLHSAPFNLSKRFINRIKYSPLRSVRCGGLEKRLNDCSFMPIQDSFEECESSSVNIVCSTQKLTACKANTTAAFRDRCYRVYYEEKSYKDAIKSCKESIEDGQLIEVKDWAELNFITELLEPQFITTRVWTGGHLLRSEVEDNAPPFPFWYGSRTPITDYPELNYPAEGKELGLALDPKEPPFMSSTPWSFLNPDETYPFVCYSKMLDIGCLMDSSGSGYEGSASRTESGATCIPWNSPGVPTLFSGQDSWNHNYCRNPGGDDEAPLCFIDPTVTDFCSVPLCNEKEALRFLDSTKETPSLCQRKEPSCGPEHFECEPGVCIFSRYVCDGVDDCRSGADEQNCMSYTENFGEEKGFKLGHREVDSRHQNVTLNECARICIQSKYCSCLSFSYRESSQDCIIGTKTSGTYPYDAVLQEPEWNYYSLKKTVEETNCQRFKRPAGTPIEGIRAIKGENVEMVEVKIESVWGGICDDGFGQTEADVLCRQLGFLSGSIKHEIGLGNREDPISVYDLKCFGNETSIADCDFMNHISSDRAYCSGNERIGVRCRDEEATISLGGSSSVYKCPIGEWKCIHKEECIDSSYLCDGVEDCTDGSDEKEACEAPEALRDQVEKETLRLSDEYFGFLEILHGERWSPLCEKDFGTSEAKVVCRMLGLNDGAYAKVHKEPIRKFDNGNEPLWISLNGDKQCTGDELSLADCKDPSHWKQFHGCTLNEEVHLTCIQDGVESSKDESVPFESASLLKEIKEELSYNSCGVINEDIVLPTEEMNARIVGGTLSRYGRHPWQAAIRVQTREGSFHWCGAVIIGKRHLLSAAHCLKEFPMSAYLIRVGDHVLEIKDEAEAEYEIEEIVFHEHYNVGPYLNNDIAIVKIKSQIGFEYGKYVSAICLPPPYFVYRNLEYVTISGWGRTGFDINGNLPKSHPTESGPIPKTLQSVEVPMVPKSRCKEESIYGSSKLTVGMFCAGNLDGSGDSCQGDSGGPAVAEVDGKYYLFGITSWGYGCGQKNKPGVYTKVSNYIYWIKENLVK